MPRLAGTSPSLSSTMTLTSKPSLVSPKTTAFASSWNLSSSSGTGSGARGAGAGAAAGRGGGAWALGREPLRELIAGEGLRLVDFEHPTEAAVVVVSGWRDFNYDHLLASKRALDAGAALLATSHDPTMPMTGG